MLRNGKEADNHMYEECKPTVMNGPKKNQVESYKEGIVVEKEELIMKKEMENRKY